MQERTQVIDQDGTEVLDPRKALAEQTLAVDLAGVEFDRAIATAHKFPRSIDVVIKKIETMACYNEESAANCIYSLPRGGKPIIGPSIGFANILAAAWGNCVDGGRPTYTDRKEKSIYAEGVFHDLESNRRTIIHESRRIVGKNGHLYSDDMIIVTGKAAAAIARRNAILNAVPRAIWWPIYEQALRIVRGSTETFAERKDKALRAFAQFGIKPEQVFLVLGLKGEADLTLEHIPTLRGMYQQLRDGVVTVEEMFDPRRMTGRGFETVENPLGEAEATAEPAEPDAPEPEIVIEAAPRAGGGGGGGGAAGASTQLGGGGGATFVPATAGGAAEPKPAPAVAAPQEAQPAPAAREAAPEPKAAQAANVAQAQAAPPATVQEPIRAPAPVTSGFREPEEYLGYWESFTAECRSLGALVNQWSTDRTLRTQCRVIGDHFGQAKIMRDQAEERLRKAGAA